MFPTVHIDQHFKIYSECSDILKETEFTELSTACTGKRHSVIQSLSKAISLKKDWYPLLFIRYAYGSGTICFYQTENHNRI